MTDPREHDCLKAVEGMAEAVVIAGEDFRIRFWNQGAAAMFGYSPDEALGEQVTLIIPERHHEHHDHHRRRRPAADTALRMGTVRDLKGLRKDGTEIPIEISCSTWTDGGERSYAVVIRDGAERVEADRIRHEIERKLREARDDAHAANEAKSQFLANMSHEIRTPLNAIIGMSELLGDTELDGTQREYVQTFRTAGEALLRLVNQILDLSKIEEGHIDTQLERFNLIEALEETLDLFTAQAHATGLELSLRVAPGVPVWVETDPGLLRQILMNLLGNALKFTERGGVTLEVRNRDGGTTCPGSEVQLDFSVMDTGIGIAQEKMKTIFERFEQADTATGRRYGGSGLGLTLSRGLAELVGGELSVESKEGVGSAFTFGVPMMCVDATAPAYVVAKPNLLRGRPPVERGTSSSSGPSMRILVVDDSPENCMLLEAYLAGTPHEVTTADGGVAAVELVGTGDFDVVLMDVQMPDVDGLEATRRIRRLEAVEGREPTKIVAVTAGVLEADVEACVAAGCDAHLPKPIRKDALLEVVTLTEATPDSYVSPVHRAGREALEIARAPLTRLR